MGRYLDAIKRPFKHIDKTLIGCLFNIVPVVNFISLGYILKFVDHKLQNKNDMPLWKDHFKLFLVGLIAFAAVVVYFLPLLIASIIIIRTVKQVSTLILLALVLVLVLMFITYLLPYVLVHLIKAEDFSAIFSFSNILKHTFTWQYLKDFMFGFSINILINILGFAISLSLAYLRLILPISIPTIIITIIDTSIISFLSFIGLFIFMEVIAETYKKVNH